MAPAEADEMCREKRDGPARCASFLAFFSPLFSFLKPSTLCYLRISCYSLPAGHTHTLLSTSLLFFYALLGYFSFVPGYHSFLLFYLCVVLLLLFATSNTSNTVLYLLRNSCDIIGQALLVLTIDLSRLKEHNDKPASLLVQ